MFDQRDIPIEKEKASRRVVKIPVKFEQFFVLREGISLGSPPELWA